VLVLGGARSGKSREAERMLAAAADVTYVATGGRRDGDPEWAERIAAHRSRRPPRWRTVETLDVAGSVRSAGAGQAVLVDCLALWLAGLLDAHGAWDADPPTATTPESGRDDTAGAVADTVAGEVGRLTAALRDTAAEIVLVSNEVGMGVVPPTRSGRLFRDLLGQLNAAVSAACDETVLLVAGRPVRLP
jgi:adenosylcobinamide kinase/adenosylcobinamide-phosphate guanylyltransferase